VVPHPAMIVAIATTAAPPATAMMGRLMRFEFEFTTHTPFQNAAQALCANRLLPRSPGSDERFV
jgi:hypothetical protein